ncbi:hypothetical protein AURDEDRAFT_115488 [Auricularia subglabra TFB-10046 SS5]|uniref:Uncharacterized protein n=1 Tax=Auricularia subglabra (strain TFB-10046 / SS5) TaxID=717982 RepID=J0WYS3_AURST|nr:hypothetical protein AURDEDRAFT_115488 [Auricularia subglabra TFB-10046 SS5]
MSITKADLLSLFLAVLTIFELGIYVYVKQPAIQDEQFSYKGADHPNAFSVPDMKHVALYQENTVHYPLTSGDDWERLSPRGGLVFLGPEKRPFMLGHFHQMQCLDTIRQVLAHSSTNSSTAGDWKTRHCMNYLRQMVMCRANTRLERSTGLYGAVHNVISEQDHVCLDWRVVYDAVRENHHLYDTGRAPQ